MKALALVVIACVAAAVPSPARVPGARGVTVSLPPGWQKAPRTLTPHLLDPREVLSVGTYPLRYRRSRCEHMPNATLHDLGPRDAFVTLQERAHGSPAGFPPRPAHFGATPDDTNNDAVECAPGNRLTAHWFTFRDNSRYFYVLVAFGRHSPARVQNQAWGVLDSLQVARRH